jgi:eukaryotic-like serine/threonine-protein kinase
MFGKYRLVDQLAVGGMAQVFLAVIEGPDGFTKRCVIKTILPEYAELSNFAQMFITEAKVAALLSHPHIVQIYDFGKVDNRYYLAMEYVDGVSVEQLLRAAAKRGVPLGPRVAVALALPLLDALSYIYTLVGPEGQPLELVHRDVTPGNVLVAAATGVVKLTDFGVVKTAVNPSQTSAGMVKGKYAYMSPEQVRARPLDQRSDLFSLGVVLYEVATGRRLFRRNSLAETISAVNSGKVPPPSTLVPDFPPGLERILLRALNLDREQRYRNAQEMMSDLETFRSGQHWTAATRELAHLVDGLFPGGQRHAQSPYAKGVVPRPDTTPTGGGQHPPSSIDDPIPSVVDEVDLRSTTGAMSRRSLGPTEIGLVLAGMFLLSALIWVLLLS